MTMKTQSNEEKQYKSIFPLVDEYLDNETKDTDGCAIGMVIVLIFIVLILFIIYICIR